MSKLPLWKNIANVLTEEIKSAQIPIGAKLPTEAELSKRFGVNRHTVRQALSFLCSEGVTWSKRGSGVFVSDKPTNYKLGDRTRFSQNIKDAGRTPSRKTLILHSRLCTKKEAAALKIKTGSKVLHYEGISFADLTPVGLFSSVFCLGKFPNIEEAIKEHSSVTIALSKCGVTDYKRHSTAVKAVLADAVQSNHLRIKPGDPLLRTESVNTDLNGNPIEFGIAHFSGSVVTLNYT